jgi:hypothetical protein
MRNGGWLLILVMFLAGCATAHQVVEVSTRQLGATGQELYVAWRPGNVERVMLEYRQVDIPNRVEQIAKAPEHNSWTLFHVRGAEFAQGGPVSAWRITLWRGDQLLAQRQSALW